MNSRGVRLGLVAAAAAAIVVIGIVLLTRNDIGAQLSPSSSLAVTSQNTTPAQTDAGTLVVTRVSDNNNYDLYLVRSDGTGLRQLAAGSRLEEGASWSPDGTRIIYCASDDPKPSRVFVSICRGDAATDGRAEGVGLGAAL